MAVAGAAAFDGERAMELVRAQCALGPRVPGTEAHRRERDWLIAQLKGLGMTAWPQSFETRLPLTGQRVQVWNVWGLPRPDGPAAPAVIVSAHWDTRPWADREPGGGASSMLGANDGASGVAMALELARDLRTGPLRERLVLAFWDAEDAGTPDDAESWALGARHAAANPPPWIARVVLGINLDMVAGEDLRLRRESSSAQSAPVAVQTLWKLGMALAPGRFTDGPPVQIVDDHLPWIRAGLPYVDIIGYPFRHWHTSGDAPDHCSAEVMSQVGGVVLEYLRGSDWSRQGRAPAGAASPTP
jgi:hypothetical protein